MENGRLKEASGDGGCRRTINNFVQNTVKVVENKKWGAREERGDVFEGQITGDSYRKIVTGMQYGLKNN